MSILRPKRFFALLVSVFVVCAAGCSGDSAPNAADDMKVDFKIEPDPPKVGAATATIKLTDKDGKPITGAALKLEGNMNHAGMTPVFADAKELAPGTYEAKFDFTMGGDWFVLIDGTLADGRKLTRKMDVPRVKVR